MVDTAGDEHDVEVTPMNYSMGSREGLQSAISPSPSWPPPPAPSYEAVKSSIFSATNKHYVEAAGPGADIEI